MIDRKSCPRWPWVRATVLAKETGQDADVFVRWIWQVDRREGGTIAKKFGDASNAPVYVNVERYRSMAGQTAEEREGAIERLTARVEELEFEMRRHREFRARIERLLGKRLDLPRGTFREKREALLADLGEAMDGENPD